MNESKSALFLSSEPSDIDFEELDFDTLEQQLEEDLRGQQLELESLKEDFKKIGKPESLGETIKDVVWEQFINQIGVVAGKDFIKENRGLTLDLRDSAHIQTTENFERGVIASHNDEIDSQRRYDNWQGKLQHDSEGNVIKHKTRSGREEANLVQGVRRIFDKGRPIGSTEQGFDIDHTVSAGEIIRNPAANAHLSEQEQITFANSDANLNEMNASHNRSKKDTPMKEWLDTPNAKGQKPKDIYADPMSGDYLSDDLEQKYRQKDAEARAELSKEIREGENRSIKTGRESQKREAFRVGGKALRSVIMGLLASMIKDIIRKLISWLRSGKKKLSAFIDSIKEALRSFFANIKQHLITATDTFITTIATAIWDPIIGAIKKAWIFLKQGYQSIKKAIEFLKDPKNKNMPLSLKMMQVGKIVIVGATAGGAIVLSEVIEKALMGIPLFATPIPLLGSLANILGMFFGALVSGLIGALALNLIDRMIAKKQIQLNRVQQIDKGNEILQTSDKLIKVSKVNLQKKQINTALSIGRRHQEAGQEMDKKSQDMSTRLKLIEEEANENKTTLQNIDDLLNQI